ADVARGLLAEDRPVQPALPPIWRTARCEPRIALGERLHALRRRIGNELVEALALQPLKEDGRMARLDGLEPKARGPEFHGVRVSGDAQAEPHRFNGFACFAVALLLSRKGRGARLDRRERALRDLQRDGAADQDDALLPEGIDTAHDGVRREA